MTPNPNEQLLKQGRKLEFTKPGNTETQAQRDARTVPIAWIEDLVDAAKNECATRIEIRNAVIHGPLELRGTAFTSYVIFIDCEFDSEITLNFARFSRSLVLNGSTFRGKAFFRAAQIADDLRMIGCVFEGESGFSDIHVGQLLNASGSRFAKTNFERIRVEKAALFRVIRRDDKLVSTEFRAELRFLDASIGVNAEFDGAQFHGDADFTRLRVEGDAFFRAALSDDNLKEFQSGHPAIMFAGNVYFNSAKIGGNAFFRGALFNRGSRPEDSADHCHVNFAEAEINGTTRFENIVLGGVLFPTSFHGNVSFYRFMVNGNAWFNGAYFGGKTTFERAKVGGSAVFRVWEGPKNNQHNPNAVTFKDEAIFRDSQMHIADFQGAVFHGVANFVRMICTDGMFAGWWTRDRKGLYVTRFHANVLFISASISGLFEFTNVECEKDVSFAEASFGAVHFGATNSSGRAVIKGTVDLRGMTYKRISCDWRWLLAEKMKPYERRQYVEMERFHRSIADDEEAGRIYISRRKEESRQMRSDLRRNVRMLPGVLLDGLQRHLLNYGIRPLRLLVLSLLFVGLGWFVFSRPDAVTTATPTQPPEVMQLGLWPALRFSLRMFVPAVDIVSGKDFTLRPDRLSPLPYLTFDAYGTIHQVAGVVLLPLGLAALAGLLIPGRDRNAG